MITLLMSLSLYSQESGKLVISIERIKPIEDSKIYLAIFNSEGSWLKDEMIHKKVEALAESKKIIITVEGLEAGKEYAYRLYHDENKNDVLDFKKFPPMPDEGTAVSNDHYRWGPPLFKKARFEIKTGETTFQVVKMHY